MARPLFLPLCKLDDVLRSPAMDGFRQDSDTESSRARREHLERLIEAFSVDAETACGRWFRLKEHVEILDVNPPHTWGSSLLHVNAFPITEIEEILADLDGTFTGITPLAATDYALVRGGETGFIRLRSERIANSVASVRVTYTGGLADSVDMVPADLRMAAVEQVTFQIKRAPKSDLQSEGQSGGSASYFAGARDAFLPNVQRVLDRYRSML